MKNALVTVDGLTPEEVEAFFMTHYRTQGAAFVAKALRMNQSTVWNVASRLGLAKARGNYRKRKEIDHSRNFVVPDLCQSHSNKAIADILHITVQMVKHDLNVAGITRDKWGPFLPLLNNVIDESEVTNISVMRLLNEGRFFDEYRKMAQHFSEDAIKCKIKRMTMEKRTREEPAKRIISLDRVLAVCKKYDMSLDHLSVLLAAAASNGKSLPEMLDGTCNSDYQRANNCVNAMTIKGDGLAHQPGKEPSLQRHYSENRTGIAQPLPITLTAHGENIIKEILEAMEV